MKELIINEIEKSIEVKTRVLNNNTIIGLGKVFIDLYIVNNCFSKYFN